MIFRRNWAQIVKNYVVWLLTMPLFSVLMADNAENLRILIVFLQNLSEKVERECSKE